MSTSQSLRLQVILGAVDQLTRPLQGMMQGSHKLSGAVKVSTHAPTRGATGGSSTSTS